MGESGQVHTFHLLKEQGSCTVTSPPPTAIRDACLLPWRAAHPACPPRGLLRVQCQWLRQGPRATGCPCSPLAIRATHGEPPRVLLCRLGRSLRRAH